MIGSSAAWSAVCAVLFASTGAVELRDGTVVDAPVLRVDRSGVEIANPSRVIRLDEVRTIEGDTAALFDDVRDLATQAWRARTRLLRGDAILAGPLFERLFAVYEPLGTQGGATGLMVAEGWMRTGLEVGDVRAVAHGWMLGRQLRGAGIELSGEVFAERVVDEEAGVPMRLGPVFLPGTRAETVVAALAGSEDALVASVRAAAQAALGHPVDQASLDGAPPLLAASVRAQGTSPVARESARKTLAAEIEASPGGWREAWARAAIGASLLTEDSIEQRDAGLLELAHVPARFGHDLPELAHTCRALLASELASRGERHAAASVRDEMALDPFADDAIAWLDARLAELDEERRNSDNSHPTRAQSRSATREDGR